MISTLISSSQRIQSAPSTSRNARPNFKTSRQTNWSQTLCVLENVSHVFAGLPHVETSRSKSVAKIGLYDMHDTLIIVRNLPKVSKVAEHKSLWPGASG